jgi:hypothetical protein
MVIAAAGVLGALALPAAGNTALDPHARGQARPAREP